MSKPWRAPLLKLYHENKAAMFACNRERIDADKARLHDKLMAAEGG